MEIHNISQLNLLRPCSIPIKNRYYAHPRDAFRSLPLKKHERFDDISSNPTFSTRLLPSAAKGMRWELSLLPKAEKCLENSYEATSPRF